MDNTQTLTLEEKLALINKQLEQAQGDEKAQIKILESEIIDPQDSLNCEGCQ